MSKHLSNIAESMDKIKGQLCGLGDELNRLKAIEANLIINLTRVCGMTQKEAEEAARTTEWVTTIREFVSKRPEKSDG